MSEPGGDLAARESARGPRFACTRCGACCTGDQKVFLSGDDLDRLARNLGLASHDELRTRAWVVDDDFDYTDAQGRPASTPRPRIRFVRRGGARGWLQCPFLENRQEPGGPLEGLCSLHGDDPARDAKPLVCHLAPLVRHRQGGADTWDWAEPAPACPGFGHGTPLVLGPPLALEERLEREASWLEGLLASKPLANP